MSHVAILYYLRSATFVGMLHNVNRIPYMEIMVSWLTAMCHECYTLHVLCFILFTKITSKKKSSTRKNTTHNTSFYFSHTRAHTHPHLTAVLCGWNMYMKAWTKWWVDCIAFPEIRIGKLPNVSQNITNTSICLVWFILSYSLHIKKCEFGTASKQIY
jgi:hypothetical protein